MEKLGCAVLAAGNARRFGANKLTAALEGRPLIERVLETVPAERFSAVTVVTQYPQILKLAGEYRFSAVFNEHPEEGLSRSVRLAPEELDLVLVPCTAFDAQCRRVGMGKGYYDRYLPRCPQAVWLGVAFEVQRVEAAAVDATDQRLDGYVTEGGIYCGTDKFKL